MNGCMDIILSFILLMEAVCSVSLSARKLSSRLFYRVLRCVCRFFLFSHFVSVALHIASDECILRGCLDLASMERRRNMLRLMFGGGR